MRNYREYKRIYESYYGAIPKDEDGRSYEIHHIDGNHSNNDPLNLVALSIREHYDVHYNQGDWWACLRIGEKMKVSPELISELASKAQKERVINGTHHLLGGKIQSEYQKKLVAEKSHPWLSGTLQRESQKIRVETKKHQWTDPEWQSYYSKVNNKKRIDDGTHNALKILTCPHCGKIGKGFVMYRYHFDKCRKAQ